MIIRGKSPPVLPSSYATVIGRNDSQRYLIGMLGLKKTVNFLTLQYVKISIKTPVFAADIPKFITFFKLIIVYRNTKAPS